MKLNAPSIGVLLLVVAALAFLILAERGQDLTTTQPAEQTRLAAPAGSRMQATETQSGNLSSSVPAPVQAGAFEDDQSVTVSDEDWKRAHERSIKETAASYSLMFRHLELSESEYGAMVNFLAEVRMSGTHMRGHRPVKIEEADRKAGIAALIGESKLEQLLALENHRSEYRETQRIADLLHSEGVPLTDAEQDQLLDVLIRVRGSNQSAAEPNVEPGTLEWVESMNTVMNEYERLVLEQAPSVLSPHQVGLVFDRYESLWTRRAAIFERQQRSRANEDPDDDFPLFYLPRQ